MILIFTTILFPKDCDIDIGKVAPNFSLKNQNGIVETLSKYKGKKVVIYFYPKNGTPGCTKEACSIRDNFDILTDKNIKVFGISYDNQKKHQEFIKKYNLQFDLLSDLDKSISKLYCADGWFLPKRKTYLIDEFGKIFKIIDDVDVQNHAYQILKEFSQIKK